MSTDPNDECQCDDCLESQDNCQMDCDGTNDWYCQGCLERKYEAREQELIYQEKTGLSSLIGKKLHEF